MCVMRDRRKCREPHTFLDDCGIQTHTSPRLNELRDQAASSGNQEATASTVFNCFSSVSAQQPGISCDSTFNENSSRAVDGGNSSFILPPPPFFFAGGLPNFELPTSVFAESWTAPQNVPWIPPPPISSDALGNTHGNKNNNNSNGYNNKRFASSRWPTPQDIPLPSTFPLPPSFLSSFPPLPFDADLSRFPPPPPPPPLWFGLPQGYWQQQQAGKEQEEGNASSSVDSDITTEPLPRKAKGRAAVRPVGITRQPSLSAQEERHLRSVAQKAKKQLHRELSRSQSVDSSLHNSTSLWQTTLRNNNDSRHHRRCLSGETPASARRVSSTHTTRRAAVSATPMLKKSLHQESSRKDYVTAARSLKGEPPRLEKAIITRSLSSRGLRPATFSRNENLNQSHRHPSTSRKDTKSRSGDHNHSLHTDRYMLESSQGKTERDGRVAEYLKDIEDLYKRLRSSYESFQRDPSSFLKNVSSTHKKTAPAKVFDPKLSPHKVPDVTTMTKKKEQNGEEEGGQMSQPKEVPLLSQESQRIWEELLKLEMQWQRLEELKRTSTGRGCAAPVEIAPGNANLSSSGRQFAVEKGEFDAIEGKATGGYASGNAAGVSAGSVAHENSLAKPATPAAVAAAGERKKTTMVHLRSPTPHSTGDQVMSSCLDSSHADQRNQCATDVSGRGEFTREHVLGLVRERKALFS